MDRRPQALVALLLFVVFTGAAIVVSGSRPGGDGQGDLPWLLQVAGYVCAVAAGVLLMTGRDAGSRRLGIVVTVATVALVLVDLLSADDGGADIGAGFARLILLVVMAVATVKVSRAVSAARRSAS